MNLLLSAVVSVALTALALPPAHSSVLTFEDLNPSPASYDVMPSPYNGFAFTGWYYGPDTVYTPASGIIDLFIDYADPSNPGNFTITDLNNQVTSAAPFIFDGAAFSGYSGVTFELWLAGSLVHTSASLPDAPGPNPYLPAFLASGYSGEVDKIVVSGVQGYYAMDNFTFHSATNTIPEPSTYALALLALGICGVIRKRASS